MQGRQNTRIRERKAVEAIVPIIDKKKTGCRLSYYMKINGLTPKDIQQYLSLSCVQTVYRWMEGSNIPTIDHLYALSQLFQVQIDHMIAGNREPETHQSRMQQAERLQIYEKAFTKKIAA